MSKIIIVGHKSVKVSSIENTLKSIGLMEPKCDDVSGKTPIEIDKIIESVANSDMPISKVWDGLALNLMVANIDKPLWGWSNPEAIHTLNYWRDIDSSFAFILSYDKPSTALLDDKSNADLESILMDWVQYNQKILQFYMENKDRCLLFHQEQFDVAKSEAINLLSHNIKEISYKNIEQNLIVEHLDSLEVENNDVGHQEMILEKYVLENIIQQYPIVVDLYEKLQAVSDLPLCNNLDQTSPILAWQSLEKMKADFFSEKDALVDKVCKLQEQVIIEEMNHKATLKDMQTEHTVLLEQLHIAQEEVEKLFHKNDELILNLNMEKDQSISTIEEKERITQQLSDVEKLFKKLEENELAQKQEIQRLNIEAKQLVSQKDTLQKEKQKAEHENFELLKQMHIVQEELEKFYLQSIKREEKKVQGPYGAADRIKSQLSYRIGATMIKNGSSLRGCLSMPFSLWATYRSYKKDMKNKPKLPPIHSYQDYYDVARVQGHLSYRLGNYFVKNIKKPWKWFVMPWTIRKITKDFRANKA